jgi:peptidoglycan/LPS O-acetylase OafA/YrhL
MTGASRHVPQLDSLRALAVAGVFVEHFTYNPLIREMSTGQIGVRLFFVLSGYLITGILLGYQEQRVPLSAAARHFWLRRLLRLTPPLAVALVGALAVGLPGMDEVWWVHALYLTNFDVAYHERWPVGGHFWTLAAEEQFYLLWFFVILLAPRRWLPALMIACLLAAPLFRSLLPRDAPEFAGTLLPGQLDSLALGALLSLSERTPRLAFVQRAFADRRLLLASGAAVAVLAMPVEWPFLLDWIGFPIAINLMSACAIWAAVHGSAGVGAWRPLSLLPPIGRISYGLYVYHYLMPPLSFLLWPQLGGVEGGAAKLGRVLIWLAMTFVAAGLSWLLLERPLLALKHTIRITTTRGGPATEARAVSGNS